MKRFVLALGNARSCPMQPAFRNGFLGGLFAACILGTWLFRLWGAENQVRLHSEHLLRQVEKRSWSGVENFLAPDYHDDWGDDRALLLQRLRLVLRMFSSLTISASEPQIEVQLPDARWRARVQLTGAGPMAPEVIAQVNGLTTPFVLHWRRQSWHPWDWKLVRVTNESLEIRSGVL